MMVATRRMAKQALPAVARLAPRTPPKRGARVSAARSARSPPATPVSDAHGSAAAAAAKAPASQDELELEKLDARVSLKKGLRQLEQQLQAEGFDCVAGVDEAGRGPLVRHPQPSPPSDTACLHRVCCSAEANVVTQCGPVVAGACHIPLDVEIEGIDDSKQLNEQQREAAYEALTSHPRVRWCAPFPKKTLSLSLSLSLSFCSFGMSFASNIQRCVRACAQIGRSRRLIVQPSMRSTSSRLR
jgi:ribonuclease HII